MSTVSVGTVQSNTSSPVTFKNSSGTEIGTLCRAFCNFNGTGTVAIRAAFNVSSITDNGTGDYTVNFTNALPDANYSAVGLCRISGNIRNIISLDGVNTALTTGSVRVRTLDAALLDADFVCVSIFR